jgi:hypothetical protein
MMTEEGKKAVASLDQNYFDSKYYRKKTDLLASLKADQERADQSVANVRLQYSYVDLLTASFTQLIEEVSKTRMSLGRY